MPVRNQNWYNLQSTRRYPLDDRSTGDDDAGAAIRDDIIVDCHLRFPAATGEYAYIQGITVSDKIVTVLFGVADNLTGTDNTTIAAVSIVQPAASGVNYSILPLQAGVSGWITFGPGIDAPFVGRYSTAAQTLLNRRNARSYAPLPIPTIGKLGVQESLTGLVRVIAESPVTATYHENYTVEKYDPETNSTNTEPVTAIVFAAENPTATYNPYAVFLGPCGQRPESGTCPKTPIETIGGVSPDCVTGNINIYVTGGMSAQLFAECGGIDITTNLGLAEACNEVPPGTTPRNDICCPGEDGASEFCWPEPATTTQPAQPMTAAPSLPVVLNFAETAPTGEFDIAAGVFSTNYVDDLRTYTAQNQFTANIALYRHSAADWAAKAAVSTTLLFSAAAENKSGGIILNYTTAIEDGKYKTKYIFAALDFPTQSLQVFRYDGARLIKENEIATTIEKQRWYRLDVAAVLAGNNTAEIKVHVTDAATQTQLASLITVVPEYEIINGRFGIATNGGVVSFHNFEIT